MTNNSIIQLLRKVDIFSILPPELMTQFADRLKVVSFEQGSEIIRKGDEGDSMFILESGRVKIHDGEHVVATINAGNFFGEFSLLDAAPRSMSVTALEPVNMLPISRELFYELFQSSPEVAKKIIATLTKRLRGQNDAIIKQLKMREEELTQLVNERTKELHLRNEEITIKNKEITDNVNYAKRIQMAILPENKIIKEVFEQSFVLYMPKDIVSGDFYYFSRKNDSAILVAADCTGHGVTGAFLSVVGNSLLNQIIIEKQVDDPGKILDKLNEEFIVTLNQRSGGSTDGMDISICYLDMKNMLLKFAGANRPLWLIRNNELEVFSPDKYPVGGMQILHQDNFRSQSIQLKKNDTFYIFTDGYADQFGGEFGKKIMTKKFKEILLSIQSMDMNGQQKFLQEFFVKWRGQNEQIDDVLVIGVRV